MIEDMKLYEHRDYEDLEPHFGNHMMAMTAEKLYGKVQIAGELAYRDMLIADLEKRLAEAETALQGAMAGLAERDELKRRLQKAENDIKYLKKVDEMHSDMISHGGAS